MANDKLVSPLYLRMISVARKEMNTKQRIITSIHLNKYSNCAFIHGITTNATKTFDLWIKQLPSVKRIPKGEHDK